MATKFDEKLIKEIVGSPHNYWLTVKASKDTNIEIDICRVVDWNWDLPKARPTLKQAMQDIVAHADWMGRQEERKLYSNTLKRMIDGELDT